MAALAKAEKRGHREGQGGSPRGGWDRKVTSSEGLEAWEPCTGVCMGVVSSTAP